MLDCSWCKTNRERITQGRRFTLRRNSALSTSSPRPASAIASTSSASCSGVSSKVSESSVASTVTQVPFSNGSPSRPPCRRSLPGCHCAYQSLRNRCCQVECRKKTIAPARGRLGGRSLHSVVSRYSSELSDDAAGAPSNPSLSESLSCLPGLNFADRLAEI
jgi:hypothetical protein